MINYAPVLIITLNRFEHLKRCLESLSACSGAEKTDLFIFLDYPLKKVHIEGYELIKSYLPKIEGFKTIKIIERERNYGVVDNFFKSLEYVFKTHNRLIFSEDDNVFSTDFLLFINRGLESYKDREDIFSISGNQYPVTFPINYEEINYAWQGFSAWGVGIWKEKWGKVNFDSEVVFDNVKNFMKRYRDVYKFQNIANNFLPAMLGMLKHKCYHVDSLICLFLYQKKMYSIYPTISRVRNTGHDGSGTHSSLMSNDIYGKQLIYSGDENYKMNKDIKANIVTNKILYNFFKTSYKIRILSFLKLFLFNIGLLYKGKNSIL